MFIQNTSTIPASTDAILTKRGTNSLLNNIMKDFPTSLESGVDQRTISTASSGTYTTTNSTWITIGISEFTARVAGVYLFSVTLDIDQTSPVTIKPEFGLFKNTSTPPIPGSSIKLASVSTNSYRHSINKVVAVELAAGDKVNAKMVGSMKIKSDSNGATAMSVILL